MHAFIAIAYRVFTHLTSDASLTKTFHILRSLPWLEMVLILYNANAVFWIRHVMEHWCMQVDSNGPLHLVYWQSPDVLYKLYITFKVNCAEL